jgi:hypothetical protein
MLLNLQFKIKENPLYMEYLRRNSNWYKILNRHPELINNFIDECKTHYQIRPVDRINDLLEKLELVQTIINTIK